MTESIHSLAALRRKIALLDRAPVADSRARVAPGHAEMDGAPDGGLLRGRVHELFGAREEESAAAGVALALARR